MDALIVVDIQNDFMPGGALAVSLGDEILEGVNLLQPRFPLVVATQDWHPAGHGSFASAHTGSKVFETTLLDGLQQVLWPDHCVQGTAGADFDKRLHMHAVEAIFRKGTDKNIDSYSGFFDNGKKKATGMGAYLKGRGANRLYLCGLAADYCVGYTALDALSLGFQVLVIEDATRAIDAQGWEIMQASIIQAGGQIIHSSQIA